MNSELVPYSELVQPRGPGQPFEAIPSEAKPARQVPARPEAKQRMPGRELQVALETPEPERKQPRTALPRLVLGSRLFSIRVPPIPDIVACELCSTPFSAHGPTGYYEERPICDRCLLEQDYQLGMLLVLSIFIRNSSELAAEPNPTGAEARIEMLAFARIYELFSARYGPPRSLDFAPLAVIGTIF